MKRIQAVVFVIGIIFVIGLPITNQMTTMTHSAEPICMLSIPLSAAITEDNDTAWENESHLRKVQNEHLYLFEIFCDLIRIHEKGGLELNISIKMNDGTIVSKLVTVKPLIHVMSGYIIDQNVLCCHFNN